MDMEDALYVGVCVCADDTIIMVYWWDDADERIFFFCWKSLKISFDIVQWWLIYDDGGGLRTHLLQAFEMIYIGRYRVKVFFIPSFHYY